MATFIQTDSCAGTTTPTNAGSLIRDAQYGIDATLSGFIIQNVSISETRTYDSTYDQKNALVSELDTDATWEMQMTVIGGDGSEDGSVAGIVAGDTSFSWNDHTWKVRSVQYNGVYNDKKSYTVTAFRAVNFPA